MKETAQKVADVWLSCSECTSNADGSCFIQPSDDLHSTLQHFTYYHKSVYIQSCKAKHRMFQTLTYDVQSVTLMMQAGGWE